MTQMMRWMTTTTAVAVMVTTMLSAGAALAETATDSGTTPAAPSAAITPPKQTSQPQHHDSKPKPTPHRKAEAGTLKITNKQTRMFTLDCDTCSPDAKDRVYQAPAAMNLHALDGKRVRVTFDTMGKVQSVHRIDAHRHVTTGKKEA